MLISDQIDQTISYLNQNPYLLAYKVHFRTLLQGMIRFFSMTFRTLFRAFKISSQWMNSLINQKLLLEKYLHRTIFGNMVHEWKPGRLIRVCYKGDYISQFEKTISGECIYHISLDSLLLPSRVSRRLTSYCLT
jgi:hypothetical protein